MNENSKFLELTKFIYCDEYQKNNTMPLQPFTLPNGYLNEETDQTDYPYRTGRNNGI